MEAKHLDFIKNFALKTGNIKEKYKNIFICTWMYRQSWKLEKSIKAGT